MDQAVERPGVANDDIQLNWYDDFDVSTLIDVAIKGIGGYVAKHNFLLAGISDGKFPDEDSQRYFVLVTPAIDIAGRALPVDYFLDKSKQQRNSLAHLLSALCQHLNDLQQYENNELELKRQIQKLLHREISETDKGDTVNLIYNELIRQRFSLASIQQRIAQLDQEGSIRDIFDEVGIILAPSTNEVHIKILFPYNLTLLHWLAGEIKIHKKGHSYTIEITAHNPRGNGEISNDNYKVLCETLRRKITALNSNASFQFQIFPSADFPRQALYDDNACGVIVVEDLVKRISGTNLLQARPYPTGAKEIRKKHIAAIKSHYKNESDVTRVRFLANRQNPGTDLTAASAASAASSSSSVVRATAITASSSAHGGRLLTSSLPAPSPETSTTGGVYNPASGKMVSYNELETSTNRFANFLLKQFAASAKDTKRVAVFMPQSLEYWECFYALHKADMAIMPISPFSDAPAERLGSFLEGGAITTIISHSRFKKHPFFSTPQAQALQKQKAIIFIDDERMAIESAEEKAPATSHQASNLAYIINTSGSTGKPKQVLVSHEGIPLCTDGHIQSLHITAADSIAGFADVMFDAHIVEMDAAKKSGANFFIVPEEYRRDLIKLAKFYQSNHITVGVFVASMLRQYKKSDFPDLRVVICTGEKIDDAIIREWGDKVLLVDGYGPAENTIATWLKLFHVRANNNALEYSIEMKIIPETECLLLQQDPDVPGEPKQPLKLVQPGEEGILFIAGKSLALGYSNPELTAERFKTIKHPTDSRSLRVYNTRDVAIRNADGSIDITGRLDRQVKVYGKLLCPEEIEGILIAKYKNILAKVYADAKINERGHPELVLYYELCPGQTCPSLREMAETIQGSLGQTFVPTAWIDVGKFPTLDSGKVDTKKVPLLKALEVQRIHGDSKMLPQSDLEKELADLFLKILAIPEPNFTLYRDDSFIDLGGKSLQATVLLQTLRNEYALKLSYEEFTLNPTVAQLARAITRLRNKKQLVPLMPLYVEQSAKENAPVFFLHSLIGNVERDAEKLKRQWNYPRSLYGISARAYADPADMDSDLMVIAYDYYRAIKQAYPRGPKIIAGWSLGGILAVLVKHFFLMEGDEDVAVMMIDSESPTIFQAYSSVDYARYLKDLFEKKLAGLLDLKTLPMSLDTLSRLPKEQQVHQLFAAVEVVMTEPGLAYKRSQLATVRDLLLGVLKVRFNQPIDNVTLVVATETKAKHDSDRLAWPAMITIEDTSLAITASHDSIMLEDGNAKRVAEHLQQLSVKQQNSYMSNRLADDLLAQPSPGIDIEELQYYIALNGCRNNNQSSTFPLFSEVRNEFLNKPQKKFMLLIGSIAGGKTMFLSNLAEYMRKNRILFDNRVVLYIPLAAYEDPQVNLVEKHLRRLGHTDAQVAYMKKHMKFTIILDGREEIVGRARYMNIFMTNKLNEFDAQVIMGVRDTFFFDCQDKSIFYPLVNNKPQMAGIVEFYLSPFRPEQIKEYIETFLANPPEDFVENITDKLMTYLAEKYPDDSEEELKARVNKLIPEWLKPETYLKHIENLPGVLNVISTPFLLRVFMEICIDLVYENEDKPLEERIQETEAHALDLFLESIWDRQAFRLMSNPDIELPARDIRLEFEDYCIRLALRMKLADVTQVTYRPGADSPFDEFFSAKPEVVLKRSGAPLKRLTQGPTVTATTLQQRRRRYNTEHVESGEVIGWFHPIFIEHIASRAMLKGHPETKNATAIAQQFAPKKEAPAASAALDLSAPVTMFFAKPGAPSSQAAGVVSPLKPPAAAASPNVTLSNPVAEMSDEEALQAALLMSMESGVGITPSSK